MTTADTLTVLTDNDLAGQSAGAIVWWRLSGNLELDTLKELWVSEHLASYGLPESWQPSSAGPQVALHRAMQEQKSPRRLVRSLPHGAGWAVVDESARTEMQGSDLEATDLAYSTNLKVALDKVGRLRFSPEAHDLIGRIHDDFERFQRDLTATDVSSWFVKMMDRLGGIPLRDTGGIYFMPAYALPRWMRLVKVLRACSKHTMASVPAMRTEETVEAVKDALCSAAEAEFENTFRELSEGLGKRAIQNREASLKDTQEKISRYEKLLGVGLVQLHEQAEKLAAALAAATLSNIEVEEESAA